MARNSDLEEMSSLEKISRKKSASTIPGSSTPPTINTAAGPVERVQVGLVVSLRKEQLENFVSDLNHKTH